MSRLAGLDPANRRAITHGDKNLAGCCRINDCAIPTSLVLGSGRPVTVRPAGPAAVLENSPHKSGQQICH
jgi:hypothetical protein